MRLRERLREDAGTTLMELTVGLSIMAVFMAIFTTGIVTIYGSVNRTEAASVTQSQVNTAFLRLDKEIRYARAISAQGVVGTDPYVEYLLAEADSTVVDCIELRVDSEQLQRRTWPQSSSAVTSTGWQTLIDNVTSAAFTRQVPGATYSFQRLEIQLSVTVGLGDRAQTRSSDLTFTALNTTTSTTSDATCTDGRLIP
jgi:type II secretory pathway component PulJ